MRDYYFNGTPVAQLATECIKEQLDALDGIVIRRDDRIAAPLERIEERLRLELFIRERNLRSGLEMGSR